MPSRKPSPSVLSQGATPIHVVREPYYDGWLKSQPEHTRRWIEGCRFKANAGHYLLLPASDGGLESVVAIVSANPDLWSIAALPSGLPEGTYRLESDLEAEVQFRLALGWKLASYHFSRYRAQKQTFPALADPEKCDVNLVQQMADAIFLARDLINTPAEDMGPAELSQAVRDVADRLGGTWRETVGDALLEQNFPSIHGIGRASHREPRLIELTWGNPKHPKVTLVGKGVCFDTGGLDIKPSSGMLLMKKDMGGAATVLGLAQLIMAVKLPIRLKVLIPAVDNAIAGNAIRPLDIITSRKGITVEIGNTDAEGRVILCDALAEADSEKPEVLIDMATLTGAARTALGPELPAVFTDDDALYDAVFQHGLRWNDPVWRLPLWKGYEDYLKSKTADITNAPDSPFAGAITAALYLKRFVEQAGSWMHIDMMAWNPSAKPGRPYGGEAMTLRAVFGYLNARYGT